MDAIYCDDALIATAGYKEPRPRVRKTDRLGPVESPEPCLHAVALTVDDGDDSRVTSATGVIYHVYLVIHRVIRDEVCGTLD